MSKRKLKSGWSLYWVYSDGLEDCFVVARNKQSAKRVERNMNGFDVDDLEAYRVMSIPKTVYQSYFTRCKRDKKEFRWPWYAGKWLLQKLGAQFREIDGIEETLIDDTVFSPGNLPRIIGKKFFKYFFKDKIFSSYGEEDSYSSAQMALLNMLGVCVARCQEIENLIARSFIFHINDGRSRNETIKESIQRWGKKTLGQLIKSIEVRYNIEPTVRDALYLFLSWRNKIVHGATVEPQYDIHTAWGRDELASFLAFFEFMTRPIRKAFRASMYASIELANFHFSKKAGEERIYLTKKQKKEISLFVVYFELKQDILE